MPPLPVASFSASAGTVKKPSESVPHTPAMPCAESAPTGSGGIFYGGGLHQLGVQALGLVTVGVFTFATSFGILWLFKVTIGIRTEEHVETAGLDVSEHGMWGYPEFYIPVPGGYGTETHGHMGPAHAQRPSPAATATSAVVVEPTS